MRLLFVSHSLPPAGGPMENVGGMQRVAVDLHDSLTQHPSVELTALVLRSAWDERAYRTPVFLAHALREIRRAVRAQEVDAVLFSSLVTASLAVPLRKAMKQNGVVAASIANGLDATTSTWPYPLLVNRTLGALDLVMPISFATAEACLARGLDEGRCRVVPLGIREDRFAGIPDSSPARAQVLQLCRRTAGTTPPRIILCSVGRLVPRKGVAWFVTNVMPLLPADVHYLIAGDGPERIRIAQAIALAGCSDRVTMLGAIPDSDLAMLYAGSDLFIMPNVPVPGDMEGFGLVILEAGLSGTPAIASDLEGIRDVVAEGENGHRVGSGNAHGFRDAIMRYHDNMVALREASERAQLWTKSRFRWSAVVDKYLQHIAGVRP